MSEPIFRSCIVSQPLRPSALCRKLPAFAVATTVYLAGGAGLLLAPLFMLEMDRAPGATIAPPDPPPIVFRNPTGRQTRSVPAVPRIRRGGDSPDPARADRRREPLPRPESNQPPAIAPLERPAPKPPSGGTGLPGAHPGDATAPGHGHPDGDGLSPDGSPRGCRSCDGGGDASSDPLYPYDEGDDRITTAARLIPGTRAVPSYPDIARRAGLQGSVILLVVIGVDGRVGAIEVLRSPDPRFGFDLAAIEAVKQWRYSPALMQGRPVAVQMRVYVEFALAR